jgi:hypothetical protein
LTIFANGLSGGDLKPIFGGGVTKLSGGICGAFETAGSDFMGALATVAGALGACFAAAASTAAFASFAFSKCCRVLSKALAAVAVLSGFPGGEGFAGGAPLALGCCLGLAGTLEGSGVFPRNLKGGGMTVALPGGALGGALGSAFEEAVVSRLGVVGVVTGLGSATGCPASVLGFAFVEGGGASNLPSSLRFPAEVLATMDRALARMLFTALMSGVGTAGAFFGRGMTWSSRESDPEKWNNGSGVFLTVPYPFLTVPYPFLTVPMVFLTVPVGVFFKECRHITKPWSSAFKNSPNCVLEP